MRYVDDNNYYFAACITRNLSDRTKVQRGDHDTCQRRIWICAPVCSTTTSPCRCCGRAQLHRLFRRRYPAYCRDDASLVHGRAALVTHLRPRRFDNVYVKPTACLEPVLAGISAVGIRPASHVHRGQLAGTRRRPATVRHQWERVCHRPQPGDRRSDHQCRRAPRFIRLDEPCLLVWPRGSLHRSAELLLPLDPQFQFAADPQGGEWRGYGSQIVTFTVAPGDDHRYEFEVRGNELSASVDGIVLARAIDNSLASGQFGFATYRAGATYTLVSAVQP